jgi:hypothetical protein
MGGRSPDLGSGESLGSIHSLAHFTVPMAHPGVLPLTTILVTFRKKLEPFFYLCVIFKCEKTMVKKFVKWKMSTVELVAVCVISRISFFGRTLKLQRFARFHVVVTTVRAFFAFVSF